MEAKLILVDKQIKYPKVRATVEDNNLTTVEDNNLPTLEALDRQILGA